MKADELQRFALSINEQVVGLDVIVDQPRLVNFGECTDSLHSQLETQRDAHAAFGDRKHSLAAVFQNERSLAGDLTDLVCFRDLGGSQPLEGRKLALQLFPLLWAPIP